MSGAIGKSASSRNMRSIENTHKLGWVVFCCLALWFALAPFLKAGDGDASRAIGVLIVVVTGALSVMCMLTRRQVTYLVPLSMLLVLYFLCRIAPDNAWGSAVVWIRAAGSFFLFSFFLQFLRKEQTPRCLDVVVYLGAGFAAYTIVQFVLFNVSIHLAYAIFGQNAYWGGLVGGHVLRPSGPLNSIGGSASIISMGIMALHLRWREWPKARRLVMLCVMLVGLYFNFTRTFVFLLIGYFTIIYVMKGGLKAALKLPLIIAAVGIAIVPIIGGDRIVDRLSDIPIIGSGKIGQGAFEGRDLLLEITMTKFYSGKPDYVFGNGLSWSEDAISAHYSHLTDTMESSTHDDIVWLLVNTGVVGIALYLLFIFGAARVCYRERNWPALLFLLLFVFLSGLGGESISISGHRYMQMTFLAILLLSGSRLNEHRQQRRMILNQLPEMQLRSGPP